MSNEKNYGIGWDYEDVEVEPYYHIYAVNGPLDDAIDAIRIVVPQSVVNDIDVQIIVDAIRRIAEREEPPR